MFSGIVNRFKFALERLLMGGARFHLMIIGGLIFLVSVAAGFLAFTVAGSFDSLFDASWWAFLRLSDPGYLGDDQGAFLRTVSTIVTILGYILFMGALIAIMTQWLNATIQRFESGLTPVSLKGHILILGWTNRTKTIVKEIIASQGRLKRFLDRIGSRKLRVVILTETIDMFLIHELQQELGGFWKQRQIILRSGTPLRMEDLKRVDFTQAGVIILPGTDFGPGLAPIQDTRTVKSLMSISISGAAEPSRHLPPVVAEVFDTQKLPVARSAYPGDISFIPSDGIISRLLVQNVRHRGLSFIFSEMLSYSEGNQIYIREFPQLSGHPVETLHPLFRKSVLMGVLRSLPEGLSPCLNPPAGFVTRESDRYVFLSESYENTQPDAAQSFASMERGLSLGDSIQHARRRVLILGWNRKAPSLLSEFQSYHGESFEIDIISLFPISERKEQLERFGDASASGRVNHIYGDYTALRDLLNLEPSAYDNILLLSSDRLDSGEEADARTIFGCILLRDILSRASRRPEIIVELMDPENDQLLEKGVDEVLISPLILSRILAHVALRPELNIVFEELFSNGGAELYFRKASEYGISPGKHLFSEIQDRVTRGGDTAIGIRRDHMVRDPAGGVTLNPDRKTLLDIGEGDEVVVLTTYG